MSVFDFPRINIKGLVQVNVGTGNNDDYSLQNGKKPNTFNGVAILPKNGQLGQSLRLGNSATVQPYDFNNPDTNKPMDDAELEKWIKNAHVFASYNEQPVDEFTKEKYIPGEWNYYGNMGMNMISTSVVGVSMPSSSSPNGVKVYTSDDPFGVLNADLSFNNRPGNTGRSTAMLIDIDPEAPQASQIFSDSLLLQKDGQILLSGKPSKAVTRWINFQRNTTLGGPNGAAGTFQSTIPLSDLEGQPIVDILKSNIPPGKVLVGMVFRFTLFRSLQKINTFDTTPEQWIKEITTLYESQGINPTYVQISGTIAPWFEGEMQSTTTGNFLVPEKTFHSPGGNTSPGGGPFKMAPAMVNWAPDNPLISLDMTASLPDSYQGPNFDPLKQDTNPKFDLGPLSFGQKIGGLYTTIGSINYKDTKAGDAAGWIFDYKVSDDFSTNKRESSNDGQTKIVWPIYVVNSPDNGDLLSEQRLFFASDQANIYAEQGLTPKSASWQHMPPLPKEEKTFSSQGYMDTNISFNAFVWGKQDTKGIYEVWMINETYVIPPDTSPPPVKLISAYKPGDPISIPVDTAGLYILAITERGTSHEAILSIFNDIGTRADDALNNFNIMTSPMINCRVLPNIEYSKLYTFNDKGEPIPTQAMNWSALYGEIFRNYYLLYPGMSKIVPLNDPNQWIGPTLFILKERIDTANWDDMIYMARTRDVSATRRWLIEAYITKFADKEPPANTVDMVT